MGPVHYAEWCNRRIDDMFLLDRTIVGVKTGGSRVGVPNCASRRMVIRDKGHDVFTQVRALSMEVKPYSCLIDIDDMGSTRVDLPRDQGG